uniref:Ig-like domain-containing protein n=1 Tax=Setaria digitata TaxID=48799 RepID=A0A915PP18_9BILA
MLFFLLSLLFLPLVRVSSDRNVTSNFTSYTESCRNYSIEDVITMNCSHSMLQQFSPLAVVRNSSINEFTASEIVSLDISYNKLENLPDFHHFVHLKRLNLEYNRIYSIPHEAFTSLRSLEEVNLSHNWISQISENAFKNLRTLRKISLDGNYLETLPSSVDMHTVQELYLNDNLIRTVPSELLIFPNLTTLSLANNKISFMQSKALINCYKLENLNLAQNYFHEVPREILQNVASTLIKLNLSSTPIMMIKDGDFANLSAIQEIDLSNTKITIIEENSFWNLPKLVKLYLNDNSELKHLYYGAFRSLPSLSLIHLHNCKLTGLHDLSQELLPSLQHLSLNGNPLLCDCNLIWLQRNRHIVMDREELTCFNISNDKRYQNLDNFEIAEHCSPRIINVPDEVVIMKGERLFLRCDAIGNPEPAILWLDEADGGEFSNGRFLMIERINRDQTGFYRCVAHSEFGLTEAKIFVNVIPNLNLEVLRINSTVAKAIWHGMLPYETSRFHVRLRDNLIELLQDVENYGDEIVTYFQSEIFSDTFELCLMIDATELMCANFDTRDRNNYRLMLMKFSHFAYSIIFIAYIYIFYIAYNLKLKCEQSAENDAIKKVNVTVFAEKEPKFYRSSALAIEILER